MFTLTQFAVMPELEMLRRRGVNVPDIINDAFVEANKLRASNELFDFSLLSKLSIVRHQELHNLMGTHLIKEMAKFFKRIESTKEQDREKEVSTTSELTELIHKHDKEAGAHYDNNIDQSPEQENFLDDLQKLYEKRLKCPKSLHGFKNHHIKSAIGELALAKTKH